MEKSCWLLAPSKAGRIQNILIIDQKTGYDSNAVTANNVGIEFSADSLAAILSMDNVTEEKRLQNGNEGDFSITQAQSADIRIQIQEQMPNYSGAAPSEMSLAALAHQIKQKEGRLAIRQEENRSQQATALDSLRLSYGSLQVQREPADSVSLKSQSPSKSENVGSVLNALKSLRNQKIDDTSLQIYRLEYQKKFVIPSACFFFALLAFPLGIGSKRAGRTAGFGIALLLSVIYWALLFAGQTFGYRQNLDPVLSMWMPNLIMFVATAVVWIFRKITKGHFL
jgi:lipopolysaccharide export system permease protein